MRPDPADEADDSYSNSDDLNYDRKECDPKYREIMKQAEADARAVLIERYGVDCFKMMGMCHSLWDEKKRILKEKY